MFVHDVLVLMSGCYIAHLYQMDCFFLDFFVCLGQYTRVECYGYFVNGVGKFKVRY